MWILLRRMELSKTSSSHQLNNEVIGILDAVFYAASKPISIDTIMKILKLSSKKEAEKIIENYRKHFNSKMKGVKLIKRKKHYFPKIKDEYLDEVRKLMKPPPLTEKQLEVLAVVYSKKKMKLSKLRDIFGSRIYSDTKKFVRLGLVSKRNIEGSLYVIIREEAEALITGKRGRRKKS